MKEYKIYPLMNGYFHMNLGDIMAPLCQGVMADVPIFFFMIEGPDGEKILVDTGYNAEGVPAVFGAHPQTEEQKFENLLAAHGCKPEDIQLVIITHLHHDHTGNMMKLPNATFIVQEQELLGSTYPLGHQSVGVVSADWEPCVPHMRLINGDYELRDGIQLISTPGHTEGHQCVLVNTSKGKVAIMGDVMYRYAGMPYRFPEAYEEMCKLEAEHKGGKNPHNYYKRLANTKPYMRYLNFGPCIAKPGDNIRQINKMSMMADMILVHHDDAVLKMKVVPDDYCMNDKDPVRRRIDIEKEGPIFPEIPAPKHK